MIHREGRRYLRTDALLDAAPQFDGHQRVHAQVEESGVPRISAGSTRVTSATASRR